MAMHTGSTVNADLGKLVLRLSLGTLFLLHGIAKILSGPAGIIGLVEKAGLPAPVGYLVYVGEVVAPLLIIFGLWTRLGALLIAGTMVFAVGLVHLDELWMLTKHGGWQLELQGMYFFSAIALALLGAGRFSVGGARGRFN